jgi:phosphoribosylanthranilate isomerase
MRVKICGITRPQDAIVAEQAGVDAIGLNFAESSKRRVTLEQAQTITQNVGVFISKVGIFVNQPLDWVKEVAFTTHLDTIQLHGQEDAIYARALAKHFRIIKAVSFTEGLSPETFMNYPADALLLDHLKGGTGKAFDWSIAAAWKGQPKLILAGGLTPENVHLGIAALEPYAVDTASGVETSPGIKDPQKIQHFVHAAKNA